MTAKPQRLSGLRVLMVSQTFDPEPGFKKLTFARELIRRGHRVEAITGFPNYPGGRIYPGYRLRPYLREEMDGVVVHRFPLYPSHDSSGFRRAAGYLSFALSAAAGGVLTAGPADVLYVYHPPASIGLPALTAAAARGAPFVLDIQDLWPDTLPATRMLTNPALLKMIGGWCRFIYRRAARIVVLSPGFKRVLAGRGVPGEKISVIYNWTNESCIRPSPPDRELAGKLGFPGRFNIVFAGNLGKAQGLETVIEAAGILREQDPRIRFVLVGRGVELNNLRERARRAGLDNLVFLPGRPISEIGKVLNLADCLLVHLKDDPLFRVTIPGKTQVALAMGKPVLMGVAGDAADLIESSGAGLIVPPENPRELAAAARRLAALPRPAREEMGARGRRFYAENLSLAAGVSRFEEVFRAAAGERRR